MMENGTKEPKKVMASGEAFMENAIQESGKPAKRRVMVCIYGEMETSMKENGTKV